MIHTVKSLNVSTHTLNTSKVGTEKKPENAQDINLKSYSTQDVLYKGLVIKKTDSEIKHDKNNDDLTRQGLRILEAAYEIHITGQEILSPEQHIAAAEKYGSFQAYQQAEWAPDKVAGRITSFALPHFNKWAAQHKNLSHDQAVDQFADLINKSIQKGYDDAMKVLGDIPEDVKVELEKTIQITRETIDAWKQQQKTPESTGEQNPTV